MADAAAIYEATADCVKVMRKRQLPYIPSDLTAEPQRLLFVLVSTESGMDGKRLDRLRPASWVATLLCAAQHGYAQEPPSFSMATAPSSLAGEYVHSEMELVAGISLKSNGTFLYGLTVGSLDEHAQGRWKAAGDRIELTSDPRPIAPTITSSNVEAAPGKPFTLRVVAPNGLDVPGVDLLLEFHTGEPLQAYLAGEPWTLPAGELRTPRFVTFSMPAYRVRSQRFSLSARIGTITNFTLTPNDFGVADLTGVHAEVHGDILTLHRPEGTMQFRRTEQ